MSQQGMPACDLTLLNQARISGGTLPNCPLSRAKAEGDNAAIDKKEADATSAALAKRQLITLSRTLSRVESHRFPSKLVFATISPATTPRYVCATVRCAAATLPSPRLPRRQRVIFT